MKKLIFRNFTKDTLNFFLIMCLIIGTIVWTLQAVNYFDFVSQDGHGLSTYFSYILFNFPKIIHRIIPFIFFISLFYILNEYEFRNELQIFWTFGVTKINFAHKIILLSVILAIFQIWFGSFFSPLTQFKGRQLIKVSNLDFFTSLIKEGKFINVVEGLTIFIDKRNKDNSYSNIFLDDSSKKISKIIIAKNGNIIDSNNQKIFRLFEGKVINKDEKKINIFEFEQIDFNLADYTSSTIIEPKIQEMPSTHLLNCSIKFFQKNNFLKEKNFTCNQSVEKEMHQELLKRFYKPIYIPVIAILSCFLIIFPKNNYRYQRNRKIIFALTFFVIVLSEASLRYSTISKTSTLLYLLIPVIIFIFVYAIFYRRVKNV
tara:strand:- start:225 stop:1340 length:1116 start_codon:yes stop_codon:yes gene_type:complete